MSDLTVELKSDAEIRSAVCSSPGWRDMGYRMWVRSVVNAPGHMGASMDILRFVEGPDGRLEIGSTRTVKGGLNLLDLIESGTKAHFIPKNQSGGPVAFVWKNAPATVTPTSSGKVVFAWVKHPGTKRNPFVERAMQQIIHEGAGISLVPI